MARQSSGEEASPLGTKERTFRTKTRILLKRLKDEANSGDISSETITELDQHFKVLYRFRQKH